jgi:hypothetical protein
MMAKLATNAIGSIRSCESKSPGSTAGKIRVLADLWRTAAGRGLRSLAERGLASFCSQVRNMSLVVLREIGTLLGSHIYISRRSMILLPNKCIKHSQAA